MAVIRNFTACRHYLLKELFNYSIERDNVMTNNANHWAIVLVLTVSTIFGWALYLNETTVFESFKESTVQDRAAFRALEQQSRVNERALENQRLKMDRLVSDNQSLRQSIQQLTEQMNADSQDRVNSNRVTNFLGDWKQKTERTLDGMTNWPETKRLVSSNVESLTTQVEKADQVFKQAVGSVVRSVKNGTASFWGWLSEENTG
jgi:hypothetical protein